MMSLGRPPPITIQQAYIKPLTRDKIDKKNLLSSSFLQLAEPILSSLPPLVLHSSSILPLNSTIKPLVFFIKT